jgi:hypothetical protein
VLVDLFEELLISDPEAMANIVIERLRDAGFVIRPNDESANSFSQLADAEAFLKSQGFWLIANTCNWTNIEGDDAGCYAIADGHYGAVKGFRVEINRRAGRNDRGAHHAEVHALKEVRHG